MATTDNGSAPAYGYAREQRLPGLTKRERAAIDLRVADSGSAWLDRMIEQANRRDAAVAICAGLCADYGDVTGKMMDATFKHVTAMALGLSSDLIAALSRAKEGE